MEHRGPGASAAVIVLSLHEEDVTDGNSPILIHVVGYFIGVFGRGLPYLHLAGKNAGVRPLHLVTHVDVEGDRARVNRALEGEAPIPLPSFAPALRLEQFPFPFLAGGAIPFPGRPAGNREFNRKLAATGDRAVDLELDVGIQETGILFTTTLTEITTRGGDIGPNGVFGNGRFVVGQSWSSQDRQHSGK